MPDDVLTPERAHEINSAMLRASMWAMGFGGDECPDLSEYSLREMLDAGVIVSDERPSSGKIECICDDRMVAALYTLTHWHTSRYDPVVRFENKALYAVGPDTGEDED